MTVDDVHQALDELSAASGDAEMACEAENALRRRVLVAIASGAPNGSELAAAALQSEGVEFARSRD